MVLNLNILKGMMSYYIKGKLLLYILKDTFLIYIFNRFALIGRNATYSSDYTKLRLKLSQQVSFPEVTTTVVQVPVVKKSSISIYEQYVKRAEVNIYCH